MKYVKKLQHGLSHLREYNLTLSWRWFQSYRTQSTDLQSKSMDRFLYNGNLRHERVKVFSIRSIQYAVVD